MTLAPPASKHLAIVGPCTPSRSPMTMAFAPASLSCICASFPLEVTNTGQHDQRHADYVRWSAIAAPKSSETGAAGERVDSISSQPPGGTGPHTRRSVEMHDIMPRWNGGIRCRYDLVPI